MNVTDGEVKGVIGLPPNPNKKGGPPSPLSQDCKRDGEETGHGQEFQFSFLKTLETPLPKPVEEKEEK